MGQYDNLRANALTLSKAGLLQTANKLNRLADYLEGKRTSLKDLSVIYSDTGEDGNAMVKVLRLQPELKSVINNAMYDAAIVMKESGSPVASEVLSDMNKISDTGINYDGDDDNPLCITAIDDVVHVTIGYNGRGSRTVADWNIQYKVNDDTWSDWPVDSGVDLVKNDKLYLIGSRNFVQGEVDSITIHSDGKFNVSGNIMSIVGTRDTPEDCEFARLFKNSTVIDASNLVLPNRMSAQCCASMFEGCDSLENAPMLTAEQLEYCCYNGMFNGCACLRSVTCYAEYNVDSLCGWLEGTSESGILFVKHDGDWTNSIPESWTVELITE